MFLKKIKSGLLKDTLVYGITNALFTGLPIILLPFLVTVLKPEDYGVMELFRSLTLVFIPIIGLSTVQSITRFYYDLNSHDFKEFTSSVLILQVFNSIIILFILLILNCFIDSIYLTLSFYALTYFLFNQITEILLSIYRIKRLSKDNLIIRLGSVILDLILLSILFYSLTNFDWQFRVIPNVLSTGLIGFISYWILRNKFEIKFVLNKDYLKSSIKYSAPLIMHMLSGYILNIGDRFFISHYLGDSNLGSYSVAYQIGMCVSFFYTSFQLAWTPTFFEWMKKGYHSKIKKVRNIIYISLP